MSERDFDGKVALVTGGARGIGREICVHLAARGAKVAVNYLSSRGEAEDLAERIGGLVVQADVGDPEVVQRMMAQVEAELGGLDYLVNNASYASPRLWRVTLEELPLVEWERVLRVDLTGTLLCCQAAAPVMRRRGKGKIVNISSAAAIGGDSWTFAYNAAKMGIVGLTRSLAKLLAPAITVNAVAPGATDSGWIEKWQLTPEEIRAEEQQILMRRFGRPEDVAGAVCFLLSERAGFITGQTLLVDGGVVL